MRSFTFLVTVPSKGTDGENLKPHEVSLYIKEAVDLWSGQFNPEENNMFHWTKDKTQVKFLGAK
jgi:hypothetical protein